MLNLLLFGNGQLLQMLLLLLSSLLLLRAEVLNLVFSLLERVVVHLLLMGATVMCALVNQTHLVLVQRLLLLQAKLDVLL